MKEQKKVSVIVPVYNGERFLDECLSRICNQTYRNLEIILVDDGSKDDSLQICLGFQKKDSRIIVKHKENGGQFSARNMALAIATGDYIGFVDNDDYLEPEFYETLVCLLDTTDADIARCEDAMLENGIVYKSNEVSSQTVYYEAEEFRKKLLTDAIWSHVTDRLFRREVIGEIRFPQSKTIEDMGFMRELVQCREVTEIYSPQPLYIYNNRQDNTSHKAGRTFLNSYERAVEFQKRYEIAKEICPEAVAGTLQQAAFFSCSSWYKLKRATVCDREKIREMVSFLKTNRWQIQKSKMIPLKVKAIALAVSLF